MMFEKIVTIGIDSSGFDPASWEKIKSFGKKMVELPKGSSELYAHLPDADALLISIGTKMGKEELEKAQKLKYIGIISTAFDFVDLKLSNKRGIVVTNTPGYSTEAVAEFVFAILLEHMREIGRAKKQSREGNYSEKGFMGEEIKGKTIGIVGLGTIGSRAAEIALGFGARVLYWSRTRKREYEDKGITYNDLDELLKKSDVVSLHVAQNKETENILNAERVAKLKKNAFLISTAGIKIMDMDAVEKRLQEKSIYLATIGDSTPEKQEMWKRFSGYQNGVIYPRISFGTKEALKAREEIFVSNIQNFLDGRPSNAVNT